MEISELEFCTDFQNFVRNITTKQLPTMGLIQTIDREMQGEAHRSSIATVDQHR